MNNLSIWKRITSPTPKFWVRFQIICLLLSAVTGHVMGNHILSPMVGGLLVGLFGGGAAFAQFAVKDSEIIKEVINDPLSIIDKIGELQSDFVTVKDAVTKHIPATIADVSKVIADNKAPALPVAETNNVSIPSSEGKPDVQAQVDETVNT
jgi:hypothetical protein